MGTNATRPTPHFGFTRMTSGEAISKNGYAITDGDVVALDNLLFAAFNRNFNGEPALGDPTDPPTLSLNATGGQLAAGTTYYYVCSFMDTYGLETAHSTEASISTAAPLTSTTAPSLTVLNSGGTVGTGTFGYVITVLDGNGGETTVSPISSVQVTSGTANSISIGLPGLPSGGASFNIYRARPGQTSLYFLANTASGTHIDTGSAEDQSITAPSINTTNSSSSITVTIPLDFIPEGCAAWRIYRATQPGGYTSTSLVHQVVEPATANSPIPKTTYIDTGGALYPGFPRDVSSTVPQGPVLSFDNFTGVVPVAAIPRGVQKLSIFSPGVVANSSVIHVTESPSTIIPVKFTAFFKTPLTAGGVAVRIRVSDHASNYVELNCSPSYHVGGDPTGYYRKEFPLLLAAKFEAETGTRSDSSVLIDQDLAASNGSAVTLLSNAQWTEVDLGQLEPGTYATFAKLRVLDFDTAHPGNDITISVIRPDTSAVLGTTSVSLVSSDPSDPTSVPADYLYQELTGPVITAPGGVDLVLRVAKATTSTQSYDVDYMRYAATVTQLQPGQITTTTYVDGGTADAADISVDLWF